MLNVISAELGLIQTNQGIMRKLSRSARHTLDSAIIRIHNSQKTIEELLELGKAGSTGRELEEPNLLVQRACHLMRQRLSEVQVSLVLELSENAPLVRVSAYRIIEVLLNLISNAAKAMLAAPIGRRSLTISTEYSPDRDWVLIVVTDTGIGVRNRFRNKLFDQYFSCWPDPEIEGVGLGLYTSRVIAKGHGGRLDLLNTRYGKGSTFRLT